MFVKGGDFLPFFLCHFKKISYLCIKKTIKEIMKEYEIGFVFFIENENTEEKDELLDALDGIREVEYDDVYDDGEDWNVECTATIECNATKKIDDAIHNILIGLLPNVCWDYHYIKGIDNDFYWQP